MESPRSSGPIPSDILKLEGLTEFDCPKCNNHNHLDITNYFCLDVKPKLTNLAKYRGLTLRIDEPFIMNDARDDFEVYQPEGIVIDIGAHVGAFSLLAALQKTTFVFAYEPLARNFINLTRNVIDNGLWGKVVPLPLAVVDHCSGGAFITDGGHAVGNSGLASLVFSNNMRGERVPVRTISFSDVVAPFEEIDLLKMDIEGGEWFIFDRLGRDELHSIFTKVKKCVNISLHDVDQRFYQNFPFKYSDGVKKVETMLSSFGFKRRAERIWMR